MVSILWLIYSLLSLMKIFFISRMCLLWLTWMVANSSRKLRKAGSYVSTHSITSHIKLINGYLKLKYEVNLNRGWQRLSVVVTTDSCCASLLCGPVYDLFSYAASQALIFDVGVLLRSVLVISYSNLIQLCWEHILSSDSGIHVNIDLCLY